MSYCQDFDEFPFHALLPKRETQASSFLAKYPTYDGRSIRIAIFDSGVDPGAPGLSITSDGKTKIIDMMDATGAGDVDTSTIVEPIDNGEYIMGLTGRKLKIPKDWKNPTGQYHVGVKNIYELFPNSLRARVKKDYFEKDFLPKHKPLLADAVQRLEAFRRKHPDDEIIEDQKERFKVMMEREELKTQVDLLKDAQMKISDLGPTFDCVVFHDGEHWKACIDTTGEGDLEKCTLLGNYRECLRYGTISDRDKFNYGVNIYDDGNLLEIVGQCSSHGTHVAAIAAANFPDDPDRNGVAPGAQIVSIVIGDSRLGTMETGSALIRAFIKAIESGCDVINMSYGEPGHWGDGRVFEMIHEMINKHGLLYVVAAGNAGPALSTISALSSLQSDKIISVGAYVTPDMMTAEYSMLEKLPGTSYSWTSRGPAANGTLGVSVCGPGGAITSVPNWSLKSGVLMNGTSMASPNVCGCVALLLSAAKQKSIPYTPYSIRMSLENTALKVPNYEPVSHGNGMVQVEKAFDHLVTFDQQLAERDIHFRISCSSVGGITNAVNESGIYLRELEQIKKPSTHNVTVTPELFKDKSQDDKINFEMNFNLICSESWVKCPKYLNLTYGSRSFPVRIDASSLIDGSFNQTWIEAYDVNCCEKGPSFKILVTVIKPLIIDNDQYNFTETFKAGHFKRLFLHVPSDSTSAHIKIRNNHSTEIGKYVLHTHQLPIQKRYSDHDYFKHIQISPKSSIDFNLDVIGSQTMEICFGKWWSCSIDTETSVEIEFNRITIVNNKLTGIIASDCITRIDVRNNGQQPMKINPTIKFKKFIHSIKPVNAKIQPLGCRDIWPEGKIIYEIVFTYTIKLLKSSEFRVSFPLLSDCLYESPYESQLWMLFDSNKQHLASGDAYPSKYNVKLDKGEYKILLQIRHESIKQLESIEELPIQLIHQLKDAITLPIYSTHYNAIVGNDSKKAKNIILPPNITTPLFISNVSNGSCLTGTKQLPVKSSGIFKGNIYFSANDQQKTKNFAVHLMIDCDGSSSSSSGSTSKTKSTSSTTTTVASAASPSSSATNNDTNVDSKSAIDIDKDLNEMRINLVLKMDKHLQGIYLENLEQDPLIANDPKFLLTKLQLRYQEMSTAGGECRLFNGDDQNSKEKELKYQIELADKILQPMIDEFFQQYTTFKLDTKRILMSQSQAKTTEKNKSMVMEALTIKGIQLCHLIEHRRSLNTNEEISKDLFDSVDDVYGKLSLLVDNIYTDTKTMTFAEKHLLLNNCHARFIKMMLKQNIADDNSNNNNNNNNQSCNSDDNLFWTNKMDIENRIIKSFKHLGWNHLAEHLERQIHVKFPNSYRKF